MFASNLMAARYLMAFSLGFHIVLSCIGVALPVVIYLAHRRGLRHDDAAALTLAKRWGKIAAVLFAVGAVSGTVLSFEMGILWPGLMGKFGSVIGLPFALEGIFFFLEAIFLGIYLYGWRGLPSRIHLAVLIPVGISGVAGTFCVLAVNAWMNDPAGFDIAHYLDTGQVRDVSPWGAMFNPAVRTQFLHMLPATYIVTGGLFASVYAVGWLRGHRDDVHRLGIRIPLVVLAIAAPVQVFTGDLAIRYLVDAQPAKFAAIELVPETGADQPYGFGGLFIDGQVRGAIEIPNALSLMLLRGDREITGLDDIPVDERPPVNVVRIAFQIMVAIGTALLALAVWLGFLRWRKRDPLASKWFVRAVVLAGPASVLALWSGWTTTEVGRQPWIARNVMLVAEAVTERGGIGLVLAGLAAIYTGLATSAILILRGMSRRWRKGEEVRAPYEPRPDRTATTVS
jgi:cytochrome d ubiquinol oxidase subunit I